MRMQKIQTSNPRLRNAVRISAGRRWIYVLVFILVFPLMVFSSVKPRYGGSLKVAQELLNDMNSFRLFQMGNDRFHSPSITESGASLDLTFLPQDRLSEIEQSVQALQDPGNSCHWILDYPYLDHRHPNSLQLEQGVLRFETREPEFLESLLGSSCLLRDVPPYLLSFRRTQFAFEANAESITGRPFLDSLTPVVVDRTNPYLSFKLRDVDVFSVPEDRYRQVQADPALRILPGPEFFIYLKTENMKEAEARLILSAINMEEIAGTVLNGHTVLLHHRPSSPEGWAGEAIRIRFDFPLEKPYRLVAERLRLQLEEAGILSDPSSELRLELRVTPITEDDDDLIRYRILREDFRIAGNTTWFELWDELESTLQIIPLMIYRSQIAVPENLTDPARNPGGSPDFSTCWFQPVP